MIDGLLQIDRKDLSAYHQRHFAVIDFEFTCQDKTKVNNKRLAVAQRELLAVGLLIVRLEYSNGVITLKHTDHFTSLIRPLENKTISEYCTNLTGITQEQADEAPVISSVLKKVRNMLEKYDVVRVYAWGQGDKIVLGNSIYKLYKNAVDTTDLIYLHQYIYDIEKEIRTSADHNLKSGFSLKELFKLTCCSVQTEEACISHENIDQLEFHLPLVDCYIALAVIEIYFNDTKSFRKGLHLHIEEKWKQFRENTLKLRKNRT